MTHTGAVEERFHRRTRAVRSPSAPCAVPYLHDQHSRPFAESALERPARTLDHGADAVLRCFRWILHIEVACDAGGRWSIKPQGPTSKLQRNTKNQIPRTPASERLFLANSSDCTSCLGVSERRFETWNLDVLWSLVLGCWCMWRERLHWKQRRTADANLICAKPDN